MLSGSTLYFSPPLSDRGINAGLDSVLVYSWSNRSKASCIHNCSFLHFHNWKKGPEHAKKEKKKPRPEERRPLIFILRSLCRTTRTQAGSANRFSSVFGWAVTLWECWHEKKIKKDVELQNETYLKERTSVTFVELFLLDSCDNICSIQVVLRFVTQLSWRLVPNGESQISYAASW